MRKVAFVASALAVAFSGVLFAQDSPIPTDIAIESVSIARTRIEHKVFAEFKVKNVGTDEVTDLTLTMTVFENATASRNCGAGAVKKSGALLPNRPTRLTVEIKQCVVFARYELNAAYTVKGESRKMKFLGHNLCDPPERDIKDLADGKCVLMLVEYSAGPKDGAPKVTAIRCTVRNNGGKSSANAYIRAKFYDEKNKLVNEICSQFDDGIVRPTTAKEFEFTTTDCPVFSACTVDVFEVPAGTLVYPEGEFSYERAVECAKWAFFKLDGKKIKVTGQIRNGRQCLLKNVVIGFSADDNAGQGVLQVRHTLPNPLYTEQTVPFEFVVEVARYFETYSYAVDFEEDPAVTQKAPDADDSDVAQVDPQVDDGAYNPDNPAKPPDEGVKDPSVTPPDKPVVEPPADPAKKPPAKGKKTCKTAKIALRRLEWVSGRTVGQGKQYLKYSGDTGFLCMEFLDEGGRPVKQTGIVGFVFYDQNGKKMGVAKRSVDDRSWKQDFNKLNADNVAPELVGYDASGNFLCVGMVRTENAREFNWKCDVTFTSSEGAVWTWKAVDDQYDVDPQAADK
jgi:hypothetical protein